MTEWRLESLFLLESRSPFLLLLQAEFVEPGSLELGTPALQADSVPSEPAAVKPVNRPVLPLIILQGTETLPWFLLVKICHSQGKKAVYFGTLY